MALKHNDEVDKNDYLANKIIYVLLILAVIICAVMLVLIIKLDTKVSGLEDSLKALQAQNLSSDIFSEVSDIDGNIVDASEAANIAEAAELEDKILWEGMGDSSSGVKRVYLTFDDGPSANTDRILDILEQYGVKATFFVVGKENYTKQYRRIVDEGHTLGMHSYSHKYSEIYESLETYKQDLTKLHDFLYEITGVDCNIVRFPGGSSNTISNVDMRELSEYLETQDMIYFDWNVSSGDAAKVYQDAERIADNVISNIDKFNNAVILFHDASNKNSTVEALPIIIEEILESSDTVFLPISEDTVKVQHLR